MEACSSGHTETAQYPVVQVGKLAGQSVCSGSDKLDGTSVDETCAQFSGRSEASPDESTSELVAEFLENSSENFVCIFKK